MARTITLATITLRKFEDCTSHVNLIGGGYKQNWAAKKENVQKIKDQASEENKKIYYESEVPEAEIAVPDMKNFVKIEPLLENIDETPEMDSRLRHLVPPQVRMMQDELKNILQSMI